MLDRKKYPPDWKKMSLRLRKTRARDRCEWCGAVYGQPHPVTGVTVVLTVAHLGVPYPDGRPGNRHDKFDVRDENLAVLCARCHLNYDRPDHLAVQARNRRRKRERAGQLRLPGMAA